MCAPLFSFFPPPKPIYQSEVFKNAEELPARQRDSERERASSFNAGEKTTKKLATHTFSSRTIFPASDLVFSFVSLKLRSINKFVQATWT